MSSAQTDWFLLHWPSLPPPLQYDFIGLQNAKVGEAEGVMLNRSNLTYTDGTIFLDNGESHFPSSRTCLVLALLTFDGDGHEKLASE